MRANDQAITFNAAGVSQGVLRALDVNSANAGRLIQAYHVQGDPVTFFQEMTSYPKALGTPHVLNPTWTDALKDITDPIYLHTMQAVMDALPNGGQP